MKYEDVKKNIGQEVVVSLVNGIMYYGYLSDFNPKFIILSTKRYGKTRVALIDIRAINPSAIVNDEMAVE